MYKLKSKILQNFIYFLISDRTNDFNFLTFISIDASCSLRLVFLSVSICSSSSAASSFLFLLALHLLLASLFCSLIFLYFSSSDMFSIHLHDQRLGSNMNCCLIHRNNDRDSLNYWSNNSVISSVINLLIINDPLEKVNIFCQKRVLALISFSCGGVVDSFHQGSWCTKL